MDKITIFTCGKSQGDPGPAAVGVYVTDAGGEVLCESKESIGNGNNSYAEYYAAFRGLQLMAEMYGEQTRDMDFELRVDSELVKKQLNNEEQINHPGLVPLFIEIHNLRVTNFPSLTLIQVKREKNREAERLANEALDGK